MSKCIKKVLFPVTAAFVFFMVFNTYIVEAKSLKKGEVYRSLKDETMEVISGNELEITESGKTFVAEYEFKGDKLRVVASVMGTKMVQYYLLKEEGLKDEKTGKVYYTKAAVAALEDWFEKQRKKTPSKMLEEYLRLVENGDVSKVNILFSRRKKEQMARVVQEVISGKADGVKKKGGIKDIKIIKEDVSDETAAVDFEITYGNGSVEKGSSKFVKEVHMWMLDD